jgi:hypothetical protein
MINSYVFIKFKPEACVCTPDWYERFHEADAMLRLNYGKWNGVEFPNINRGTKIPKKFGAKKGAKLGILKADFYVQCFGFFFTES